MNPSEQILSFHPPLTQTTMSFLALSLSSKLPQNLPTTFLTTFSLQSLKYPDFRSTFCEAVKGLYPLLHFFLSDYIL